MQKNTVAYDEGHNLKLEEKLLLKDAIFDVPAVFFLLLAPFYICLQYFVI